MKPDKVFVADNPSLANKVVMASTLKCRPSDIEYLRKETVLDFLQKKHDRPSATLYEKVVLSCLIKEIGEL